jgi:hypothetical protein
MGVVLGKMPFTNSQFDVPVGHWAYTYRRDLCLLSGFPRIRCGQHIAVYALQKVCSQKDREEKRTPEDPSQSPTKSSRQTAKSKACNHAKAEREGQTITISTDCLLFTACRYFSGGKSRLQLLPQWFQPHRVYPHLNPQQIFLPYPRRLVLRFPWVHQRQHLLIHFRHLVLAFPFRTFRHVIENI